jgi:hypothetical protein
VSDDEPRATLATSTVRHNKKLDEQILKERTARPRCAVVAAQVYGDALQYLEGINRPPLNETAAEAAVSQRAMTAT